MAENETEKSLSPAQRKAIEALLTSGSVAEATASAGVARATIYRWLQEPAFVAALREAEREAVEGLSRALAGLGDSAAKALRDALASHQKISTRLRASEIVLGNLLRIRELVELEQRIAALEGRVNGYTG